MISQITDRYQPYLMHGVGVLTSFIAVNSLIAATSYMIYPDFFQPQILFRPQILVTTIPLSTVFYLNTKYLEQALAEQENTVPTYLQEVEHNSNN